MGTLVVNDTLKELRQFAVCATRTPISQPRGYYIRENLELSGYYRLTIFAIGNAASIRDGIAIARSARMGWICQHCGAPIFDLAYRVKSEESGVVLLDMIVCQHCRGEAIDLGLHTEEIDGRNGSRARNQRSSRKKPAVHR
jgi:hypothetical protein